jgi:LPS sulfotransferase NodH
VGDVVIWHIGRCGSTVLGSALNQNRAVQWENEIFRPLLLRKRSGERIPSMREALAEVSARKRKTVQAVEVKFLDSQHLDIFGTSLPAMLAMFLEHGFDRFVVLKRRNHLRRMVSHCVAEVTKQYHVAKGSVAELRPIVLDLDSIRVGEKRQSLLAWFREFDDAYARLGSLLAPHPHCEVVYEDDLKRDPRIGYRKVCTFLGVEAGEVEVLFSPTNPFSLKEILVNYEAVRESIEKEGYASMLAEE